VTPRQRIAFLSPCYRAWETAAAKLQEDVRAKGETWSTLLSVNR
jgi:hypothetical protein